MKKEYFLIALFVLGFGCTIYGQTVDRRIIIEQDKFTFINVDDNSQIATLFSGSVNAPMKDAVNFKIPAGRGISAQTNPLAWDLSGDSLFVVSFLDHVLNDRNEAIKKMSLKETRRLTVDKTIDEVLLMSVDENSYVLNEPYIFIQNESIFRNHFYFDIAFYEGELYMAIANNGKLYIWCHNSDGWESSEAEQIKIDGFFSFIEDDQGLSIMLNDGKVYSVSKNLTVSEVKTITNGAINLSTLILIQDKIENKTYFLNQKDLNFELPLRAIIEEFGVEI